MKTIKIGIVGYGNIGRGVEKAVAAAGDMALAAVFTRRDPATVTLADSSIPVYGINAAEGLASQIDVLILCGGSAKDIPEQGPRFAKSFNIVDCYDTHAKIPEYLAAVDAAANRTAAIISTGWDPGLFSMMRLINETVLPDGKCYTFWGRGLSQGHSDALRMVEGVSNAVQYTIPIDSALESVRRGELPQLTPRQKHLRECYVALKPGADKAEVERQIKTMPDYFADYDTTVIFVDDDEILRNHKEMPHGGVVLHSGATGVNRHIMEFKLTLDSNPEFTGSVMTAYARAAYRMASEGQYGAKTVFDTPLVYLSAKDRNTLIREML